MSPVLFPSQISSTNSIAFLGNDNLTFKRFSDGTLSVVAGHDFTDLMKGINDTPPSSTTPTSGPRKKGAKHKMSRQDKINEDDVNFSTGVWTTNSMNRMLNNTDGTNLNFQYMTPSPTITATTATTTSSSNDTNNNNNSNTLIRSNGKNLIANSSAIKLLEEEDPPSKQVRADYSLLFTFACPKELWCTRIILCTSERIIQTVVGNRYFIARLNSRERRTSMNQGRETSNVNYRAQGFPKDVGNFKSFKYMSNIRIKFC